MALFAHKKIPRPEFASGFSIAALGIGQICSWGTLYYSFPQIAQALMAEMGWPKADVYGALTLGLLLSALAAIPVGAAIDRGYARSVMAIGSVLAGLLLIGGAKISSLLGFYLVFAGIGVLQAATLYDAAFAVIANRFDAAATKKHITTLTLWGGFASTVFIPVIEWLLDRTGWQDTLIVLGLINIAVGLLVYARLSRYTELNQRNHSSADSSIGVSWALRQPIFWGLLIGFSVMMASSAAFTFHLYPMLLERKLTAADAVVIIAVLGPAQVVGRMFLAAFSARVSILQLGTVMAGLLPLIYLAFAYMPADVWGLVPFAIGFGLANGVMTIVKGVAVPELLTREAYGAINGAMNVPIKLAKAFAPSVAAAIWAFTGGYQDVMLVMAALGVIAVVCMVWVTRPRPAPEPCC